MSATTPTPNNVNEADLRAQLDIVAAELPEEHEALVAGFPGWTAPEVVDADRYEHEAFLDFAQRQAEVEVDNQRIRADQGAWIVGHAKELEDLVKKAVLQRTRKGKGRAPAPAPPPKANTTRPKPQQAKAKPMAPPPAPPVTPTPRPTQKRGRSDTSSPGQPRKRTSASTLDRSASKGPTQSSAQEGLQDPPCQRCVAAKAPCRRIGDGACDYCKSRKQKCGLSKVNEPRPRETRSRDTKPRDVKLPDVKPRTTRSKAARRRKSSASESDDEEFSRRKAQNLIHHDIRLLTLFTGVLAGLIRKEDVQPWADDHMASYRAWQPHRDPDWVHRTDAAPPSPDSPVAGPSNVNDDIEDVDMQVQEDDDDDMREIAKMAGADGSDDGEQ